MDTTTKIFTESEHFLKIITAIRKFSRFANNMDILYIQKYQAAVGVRILKTATFCLEANKLEIIYKVYNLEFSSQTV